MIVSLRLFVFVIAYNFFFRTYVVIVNSLALEFQFVSSKAHGKWQYVAIKKYFIIEKMQHIVCYCLLLNENTMTRIITLYFTHFNFRWEMSDIILAAEKFMIIISLNNHYPEAINLNLKKNNSSLFTIEV